MANLNVSEQIAARSLADDLKAISEHLAGAARYSSATAHRLALIAHTESEKIDDAAPTNSESVEALKGVALLTKISNASSEIGINLLRANKEQIDGMSRGDDEALAGLEHFYGDSVA